MWGEETNSNAETVTINPWAASISQQPQIWQGMGRSNTNNLPNANNGGSHTNSQPHRVWDNNTQAHGVMNNWQPQHSWTQYSGTGSGQPANNWSLPQQSQWGSSTSPNNTYADQAKKNTRTQPTQIVGTNTNDATAVSNVSGMSDNGTANWQRGQVNVDQKTPWDTSTGTSNAAGQPLSVAASETRKWNAGNGNQSSVNNQWGQPAAVGIPVTGGINTNSTSMWSQPTGLNNAVNNSIPTGTGDWSQNMALNANATSVQSQIVPSQQTQIHEAATNWNATGPPPIGTVQPVIGTGNNWDARVAYDPNPQTPGPWVAPQPQEMMNSDMMWHDPNPKQKKIQRDTGTSVWGDPSGQRCEIRRWKDVDNPETVTKSTSNNLDWSNLAINVPVTTQQIQAATTTNSKENYSTNNIDVNGTSTAGWGESNNAIDNGNDRWGASTGINWGIQQNSNEDMKNSNNKINGDISNMAYNRPTHLALSIQQQEKAINAHISLESNNNHYNQQIEQIQQALNRGLVSVNVLNQTQKNPQHLLEIIKLIQNLTAKEKELKSLQQNQNNGFYKNEEERLLSGINNDKNSLVELQRNIIGSIAIQQPSANSNSSQNGSLTSDGQSRLQQWKKSNTNSGSKDSQQNFMSNLAINAGGDWKSGALDWSPPIGAQLCGSDSTNGLEFDLNSQDTFYVRKSGDSIDSSSNGAEPEIFDDGPPEFVPGKKWEWRDPSKMAEDPNATPGHCKPNPLLSSATLQQLSMMNINNTTANNRFLSNNPSNSNTQNVINDPKNFNAWNSNLGQAQYSNNSQSDMWSKRPPNVGVLPPMGSNGTIFSNNAPPRLMGPPPSLLGYPASSGIIPNNNSRQFQPVFNSHSYWILFQLINISEQYIQMVCKNLGRLSNFMIVGNKIACAKFFNANLETLLERLKTEYMFSQQTIKVVLDEEFDRMMCRSSNIITNVWTAPPDLWTNANGMIPPPIPLGAQPIHFGGMPMEEIGRQY